MKTSIAATLSIIRRSVTYWKYERQSAKAQIHSSCGVVDRQREAGGLFLPPGVRIFADRLRGARDGAAGSRFLRARTGEGADRRDQRARIGGGNRRARGEARGIGAGHRGSGRRRGTVLCGGGA